MSTPVCLNCGVAFTREDQYAVIVKKIVWHDANLFGIPFSTDRVYPENEGYIHAKCPEAS